jgi:TPR repeat protein
MIRPVLTCVICLTASVSAMAEETTTSARELAETQLLATWVGLPEEQFKLANIYYLGNGVARDYTEAAKWFRLAADQGLAKSQHMMGVLYDRGEGVPADAVQAVAWYRQAGERGYVAAQFELGNKYASGEGVPQNYAEAYVWFNLAAAAGHEAARKERDRFARKLSNGEIVAAQQRATQLFENIQQDQTKG